MTIRRTFLKSGAVLGAVALGNPLSASAQSDKLARLVVPFPAGGGTDAVARMTADRLRPAYPGGLIVENRTGASGRLGAQFVKGSEPDGMTLLFTPDFVMTIFPHSFRKLDYKPLQDFVPVALCAKTAYALVAGPGLPPEIRTVQQFVDWSRANPRQAAFASTTAGSASHFGGLMLARAIGVELLHVPYKGGALALQDLMGGQVPVSINPVGEVLPYLKSGRIRVLATTGAERTRFIPDAPTLVELGFREMIVESWLGVMAPARTPMATVARTSDLINSALKLHELQQGYAGIGMETVQDTPANFAAVLRRDLEKWGPIIRSSGFVAEE